MNDIALEWYSDLGFAEPAIVANDLKPDDGLRTAILISLFTDRRAELGDILPDLAADRRGWWADAVSEIEGDRIGSRLWLLARSKRENQVLDRARQYVREALAWLVEDRICEDFTVAADWVDTRGDAFAITGTGPRPGVDPARWRFDFVWTTEASRE